MCHCFLHLDSKNDRNNVLRSKVWVNKAIRFLEYSAVLAYQSPLVKQVERVNDKKISFGSGSTLRWSFSIYVI